jgi:hypothetical protein
MPKSMKALVLAGVLSIAAASAAHAGGNAGANGGDLHASAPPVCNGECPILATETSRGAQIPRLWRQAGGAASSGVSWNKRPSGEIGGHNGRAHTHMTVAGGRGGLGGEVRLHFDAHQMFAGGRGGITGEFHAKFSTQQRLAGGRGGMTGDVGNGRTAGLLKGGAEFRVAASASGAGGDISR